MTITDQLTRAKHFAVTAHGSQMYGKGLPYEYHLQKVHDEMIRVGIDDKDLLICAFLHDTIEDADINIRTIECAFGWKPAAITWAVSDGPGQNRKERKAGVYPKIRMIPDAAVVKLADRVANFRASLNSAEKRNDPRMMCMYLKESEDFYEGLKGSRFSSPVTADWAQKLVSTLRLLETDAQLLLEAVKRKKAAENAPW